MINKKRRWLWVLLFSGAALLLGALATGWNVVLVRDYQYILTLAKNLSKSPEIDIQSTALILKMTIGTLGFVVVLTLTILLFIKLLYEMRLNQLQSEFLATVSHELKTPIATIELSASLIRSGQVSQLEQERLWNSHQVELDRLRNEVNTLLEAARWQSKPKLTNKNPLPLETWLLNSLDHWKSILGSNSVLQREGESLSFTVPLDLKSLNLISDNLMSNSKKFARHVPHVKIRTSTYQPQSMFSRPRWRIEFEDHGLGFEPNDSKRIFNRFFRSKNKASSPIAGTGLGLYLAESASRAMGLTLKARSKGMDVGSVFTLEGPLSK